MTQDDNIDEFDDFGNYIGPRRESGIRANSSILGKIVVVVVAYFLITVIIDPMTTNINESEIIYKAGSYPYDKVMNLFRDHPIDSDDDGIPDKEEMKGWHMESRVLSMAEGDISSYRFHLDYSANFLINLSVLTGGTTELQWGWNGLNQSTSVNAEDWKVISLERNSSLLTADNHTLIMKVTSGNISIDWISVVCLEYEYAVALDGGDVILTNGTVTNMMVHVYTEPHNPDSDFDGMLDGYEVATGVRIGGWQDPMVTNNRYALLIAGGSTNPNDNYPSIKNDIELAYEVLHDFYGYENQNIKVLSWDGEIHTMDIVDGPGSLEEIDRTFDELEQEMGPNDFLFIYIVSHGQIGKVEVFNSPSKHDIFEYDALMENLTSIKNNAEVKRIAVVVEACHSGSTLFDVQGDDMIVISSTEPEDDSYTFSESYALFTYYFFEALEHPNLASLPSYEKVRKIELTFEEHKFISLGEAFTITRDKLRIQSITKGGQIPQIDQNGDGIPDDKEEGLAYLTYI